MDFKKTGAYAILAVIASPGLGWGTWVTYSVFESQKADAVQIEKFSVILKEIETTNKHLEKIEKIQEEIKKSFH